MNSPKRRFWGGSDVGYSDIDGQQYCSRPQLEEEIAAATNHVFEWIVGIPRRQVQYSINNGWVNLRNTKLNIIYIVEYLKED